MLLEQFIQTVERMPDPRKVDLEDALDLLVNLIEMAKTVEHVPDHVDKVFTCAGCGLIVDGEPIFVLERAYHEAHAPKNAEIGPPLGRVPEAKRPPLKEG